jgi:hypothetical protein
LQVFGVVGHDDERADVAAGRALAGAGEGVAAWVGPALFAVRAWWRVLGSAWSTRGLSSEINLGFNPEADDRWPL